MKASVATEDREATTLDDADFSVFDTTGDSDAWREIRIPKGLSAAEIYRRLPAATDVEYGKWEHLRTITVGSDWIWVWTKNPQTLKMARRLWKWELENLAPMLMASCRSHGKHMVSHYAGQALQELGLRWPQEHLLDPQRWMPMSILGRAFCSSGWDHGITVRNGYAPVRPFWKKPLAVPSPGV